jgi:hypothetical protein
MSSLNQLIAESLGYKQNGELWEYKKNETVCFVTDLPDYEHDLNAAIELYFMLPMPSMIHSNLNNFGKTVLVYGITEYGVRLKKNTPEDLAYAICEAYCQWKNIAVPEDGREEKVG